MKNTFKKVVAVVIAVMIIMTMSTTAFADTMGAGGSGSFGGSGGSGGGIVRYGATVTFVGDESYDLVAQPGTTKLSNGNVTVSTTGTALDAKKIPAVTVLNDIDRMLGWAIKDEEKNYVEVSPAELKYEKATNVYAMVFPFRDVDMDDWYFTAVYTSYKMGLINGKTETTYCPQNNMTYAEAVKLAACMNQYYTEKEVTLTNGSASWYDSYYEYCLEKGIIKKVGAAGEPVYDELYAKADEAISREMYVYIFSNSLPATALPAKNTIKDNAIPDVEISDDTVLDDAIYMMYRAGVLNGSDEKGTFRPKDTITRAEVATIVARMMDSTLRKTVEL